MSKAAKSAVRIETHCVSKAPLSFEARAYVNGELLFTLDGDDPAEVGYNASCRLRRQTGTPDDVTYDVS